jgi:hypothetical protein
VADLSRKELKGLARLGAKSRLEELRREETAIRRAFPDLFRGRGSSQAAASDASAEAGGDGRRRRRRRRRSTMSPAARKAVSERMKKYWASRRKTKAK